MEKDKIFCNLCECIISNKNDQIENCEYDDKSKCCCCFSILNMSLYADLVNTIRISLNSYEHKAVRLITNFASVFDILHWYYKRKLHNDKINEIVNTATLRKSFKPLFIQKYAQILNIDSHNESDIELIICFDFIQEVYDIINKVISSCGSNLTITQNDDRSKVKAITTEIINEQLSTVLDKFLSLDKITSHIKIDYKLNPDPFYISGYYMKLSRDLGQTKYERNGVRLVKSSVDEEIKGCLCKYYNNNIDDLIFSGGGREDRDVRMLGKGREFIYEVRNAKHKNNINYTQIMKTYNSQSNLIKINELNICTKKHFIKLKSAEDEKMKRYICIVWIERALNDNDITTINNIKNLNITQITPLRVLHKRVLKDREKKIIELKIANKINNHFFILEILSSAGTYIKEFIHGDLGRSKPSLGDILNSKCDILQLDVLDIIY